MASRNLGSTSKEAEKKIKYANMCAKENTLIYNVSKFCYDSFSSFCVVLM